MKSIKELAAERDSRVGNIAFIDLVTQQKHIRAGVERRLQAVLDHGRYIAGPEIEELEQLLAEKTGAKRVIACASGTDALIIPLMGMEVSRDDAIFIPAFTYNATANAVLIAGATPVFVDIDPDTFNMCPNNLQEQIDRIKKEGKLRPRLICAVDLFGSPADYPAIKEIATKENLSLMADGAQSFGGQQGNEWVGNLAPITGTSFFPGKALGAYGDAGAIFLNDESLIEPCESVRWHGTDEKRAESIRVGMNGRMSSFQAAVLLEKLSIFWQEVEARKPIAKIYDERLTGLATPQRHVSNSKSGYGYYTVKVDNRDAIRAKMAEANVPTAVYYMQPLHKMKAFLPFVTQDMPNCNTASAQVLSLPMHPYLSEEQAHFICDVFAAAHHEAG
ncbi:MAG: DegT/DnrJ/EryC1/StrS family aminotransferase [bacterium]